ncbi:hypothetical protein BG011_009394 [Mortierella polycephala]|uniref:Uncharacterized protein n=1 Tax=Mortierella polycephala TaxID=41804 RepID=A0A9P6PLD5_9FUNG|nr:hypothetical protein BG011_009394 [Mortierella polycephala]
MKNSKAILIGQTLLLFSTAQALQFKFPKDFTIDTEVTIEWIGQPSLGTSEQSVVLFKDNEPILALCHGLISGSGQCSFTLSEDDVKTLERGNDGYYIGLQGADGVTLDVSKEFEIQSTEDASEEEDVLVKVAHDDHKKKSEKKKKTERNKNKKESKKKHTNDDEDDEDKVQSEAMDMDAQENPSEDKNRNHVPKHHHHHNHYEKEDPIDSAKPADALSDSSVQSPVAAFSKAAPSDTSASVTASVLASETSTAAMATAASARAIESAALNATAPAVVVTETPNEVEKNGDMNGEKGGEKGNETEDDKNGDKHKEEGKHTEKAGQNNDNNMNNSKKDKKQQDEVAASGVDTAENMNTNKDKEMNEDKNEPWASVMNGFSSFGKTVESTLSDGIAKVKQFVITDSQGQEPKAQKETDEL